MRPVNRFACTTKKLFFESLNYQINLQYIFPIKPELSGEEGDLTMFWTKNAGTPLADIDNVLWFGTDKDRKGKGTQWADPDFYEPWDRAMREAFDLLGMQDRLPKLFGKSEVVPNSPLDLRHLEPVPGWTNRMLFRKTMANIDGATTALQKVSVDGGIVVSCVDGRREDALKQWEALCEILGRTTALAIFSQGLLYYVQGTQVGYTPATRHLFKRSNTLERLGGPNEPHWRANVSGYKVDIHGDWDEIKRIHREEGYTLFHQVQLVINGELEELLKKGN